PGIDTGIRRHELDIAETLLPCDLEQRLLADDPVPSHLADDIDAAVARLAGGRRDRPQRQDDGRGGQRPRPRWLPSAHDNHERYGKYPGSAPVSGAFPTPGRCMLHVLATMSRHSSHDAAVRREAAAVTTWIMQT